MESTFDKASHPISALNHNLKIKGISNVTSGSALTWLYFDKKLSLARFLIKVCTGLGIHSTFCWKHRRDNLNSGISTLVSAWLRNLKTFVCVCPVQILFLLFLTFALVTHLHAKQVQNVVTMLMRQMRRSVNTSNDASELITSCFEERVKLLISSRI